MPSELGDIRVLVVDNPTEVRNIREALRDSGFHNVSDMGNGLQVLTEIKKSPPSLVIANLILPQYSGLQVFKSLRADKALSVIKFIMTTPKLNRREVEDIRKEGVENILSRPFDANELREMIYDAFGMKAADLKETADKIFNEGKALFDAGSFQDALAKFREAGMTNPDPSYFYMQGRAYLEMNMYDQALAAFQNTMEKDRRFHEADHWLGVTLQKKKDYLASIQVLERAAKRDAAKAETHVELGKSYLGADMVDKADESFKKAVILEPDNVQHKTAIGNAYLEKEIYDKAEQAFGAALSINPKNVVLYNRMAIALRKQSKFNEAINLYIKALGVFPDDEGLFYNLARALFESGQKDKAIKALDKALSLDPEFGEAKRLREEYQKL
ncbi:MAG: tetratricopeptide repeat protein [Nitrospinae bacterium]|nr:tetratricopeptide repeat protein [Nitrospinota bacterium]